MALGKRKGKGCVNMDDRTQTTEPFDYVSRAWDVLSAIYRRSGTDVQTYLLALEECVLRLKSKTEPSHPVNESLPKTRKGSE